jgi:hypothetical protein
MNAYKINDIIDDFAKDIAKEIAEKRFYEMEEVKAIAKTRLLFALTEILAVSINNYEAEAARLKAIYADPSVTGRYRAEIGGKLGVVNDKLKMYRKAIKAQEEGDEYQKLKAFVKGRFGPEVLAEFFQNINHILP